MKKKLMVAMVLLSLFVATTVFAQAPARGGILKMTPSKQGVLQKNFNPFSPAVLESALGCIYRNSDLFLTMPTERPIHG